MIFPGVYVVQWKCTSRYHSALAAAKNDMFEFDNGTAPVLTALIELKPQLMRARILN